MSFGSRHAREKAKFNFDSSAINTYYTLKDLYKALGSKAIVIKKLWISKHSKYGDHPMITTASFHVNLPAWMLQEVTGMIESDEDVTAINNGLAAFRVVEKVKKGGKDKYLGIEWCDPDPDDMPENLPF